jgi:hypothetical protein
MDGEKQRIKEFRMKKQGFVLVLALGLVAGGGVWAEDLPGIQEGLTAKGYKAQAEDAGGGKLLKIPFARGVFNKVADEITALTGYAQQPEVSADAASFQDNEGFVVVVFSGAGELSQVYTDTGKTKYTIAFDTPRVLAERAEAAALLEQGKAAREAGKQVEALSYFMQAVGRDPRLSEAAKLVNVTRATLSSGNIGADTRNAIAWRKSWVGLLEECDQYVANYVNTTPLATRLVYNTELKQGGINWDRETTSFSFDIMLLPDRDWPAPLPGVVEAVYAGLAGTGQRETWELDWPSGSRSLPDVSVRYEVAVELLNEQGEVIGQQNVTLGAGYRTSFSNGKLSASSSRAQRTVTFEEVDANKMSGSLRIRIASLDGVEAQDAAGEKKVSILTHADYIKIGVASGWCGPAGGEIIVVNGKKLEVAPASTEFKANWSDAIARCKSLKVNGIGGWHLPTKEELDAMYQQLHKQGEGGFSDTDYWSSSEISSHAWYQFFANGSQDYYYSKYYAYSVRAVRAF